MFPFNTNSFLPNCHKDFLLNKPSLEVKLSSFFAPPIISGLLDTSETSLSDKRITLSSYPLENENPYSIGVFPKVSDIKIILKYIVLKKTISIT